jgi:hypothetical protein
MEHCITDLNGKTWKTLQDAIVAVKGVIHVYACKRTLDLEKWDISTKVKTWEHVKAWLDDNLNKLYRRIPVATRNKYPVYDDFANPIRLHSRRHAVPSVSTEVNDTYVQSIQNNILGQDTLKIPTRAPAWKATPRLVYTLDDMQAFPNLDKPQANERSLGSTATTTSLTAGTDDAIRKLENQWKTDKATFSINLEATLNTRLASMDTKIASVLSSFNATVATAIQTHMASLETKIVKMVSDAIIKQSGNLVSQVGASIAGEHSPFVTAGKLKNVLDDFIGQINTRIDTLTDGTYGNDINGSPIRKQLKTTPTQNDHDMSMDTQPSQVRNPYAETTETVAGQKN